MTKLKLDLAMQVAAAVPDVERALNCFRELLGVDEETVHFSNSLEAIDRGDLTPQIYNGVESRCGYRQVNFHCAGLDIELFEPIPGGTGIIADFLAENGPGQHHISIRLANRAEGIELLRNELGLTPLMEGLCFHRHYVYFDLRELLGITLEIGSRVVGPRAQMSQEELDALLK